MTSASPQPNPVLYAARTLVVIWLAAWAAAASTLPNGGPARGTREDDLIRAEAELRRAIQDGDPERRRAALFDLVGVGDPDALVFLIQESARAGEAWRDAQNKRERTAFNLAHREKMLAQLELRATRDETLEPVVEREREALDKMREKVAKFEERAQKEGPWLGDLGDAAVRLFSDLSRQRRKLDKRLWDTAEKSDDVSERLAAVELLGRVGEKGTATGLQKLMIDVAEERGKLGKELPKEMVEVRKMEQRLQDMVERGAGRREMGAAQEQYDQIKQRAAQIRRELTISAHLMDACVASGAAALAREPGEEQTKTVKAMGRSLKKARHGARLLSLRLMSRVGSDEALAVLTPLLERERDPAALAEVIDELAQLGREDVVPLLTERYLDHESWHVRSHTAQALARLRSKDAIGLLIERLGEAEGRLKTDLRGALKSLTGKDFRTNVELWSRWWEEAAANFEVPAVATEIEADATAKEQAAKELGVTFFGIETDSQKVLFVLDLSGSMNFSMVARDNPTDDRSKPFDMPQEGEISRLSAAKRSLVQALGGLRDGAQFGLVMYASDVFALQDGLLEMKTKVRAEILEYVDELEAQGGTNIYGALDHAFWMIGLEGGDEWAEPAVDTIYFLSDGRASVGTTTDPDEILAFVAERNRNAGIVIHTIGLSGAQDAHFLRSLAEQNDGTYASQ